MTDKTRQPPTNAVSHAIASIPDQFYWLMGKGRTKPSEPLYAVQIIDAESGVAVVETEGEDLAVTIRAAVEQIHASYSRDGES